VSQLKIQGSEWASSRTEPLFRRREGSPTHEIREKEILQLGRQKNFLIAKWMTLNHTTKPLVYGLVTDSWSSSPSRIGSCFLNTS
jgi:hypothetical protein